MMKVPLVDLGIQYRLISTEIDDAIHAVISDHSFIKGKHVSRFEDEFKKILGVNHCLGVGNGTDGLFISLKSLGIVSGNEVITAANSFIATPEAISLTGAKPVFADCNPNTYTIDPDQIEAKINSRTKAIIPVHLYGHPAEMDLINEIANHHSIPVIEDAAQAHLAEYRTNKNGWKRCGSLGNLAVFSFFPGKNLGAYGDGGAIVTNNPELDRFARMYGNHGRLEKYDHEFEGINSRLDGIQAAILTVKLKYLQEWTCRRRKVAADYSSLLQNIPVICPKEDNKAKHVYHLYVIRTPHRDRLKAFLESKGITTGIHYPYLLPDLKIYSDGPAVMKHFPVSSKITAELLSLPIYPEITSEQIEYVADNIAQFFRSH